MRSSWMWMMVLVALGSAQKPTKQMPDFNIQKMKGIWYPLATARDDGNLRPAFEFKIIPKTDKSFEIMVPVGKSGVCEKNTAIATPFEGGFTIESKLIGEYMFFVDTDYVNYHVVYVPYDGHITLYLYGRKKVVTEHMKTRFIRKVAEYKMNPRNINYNPKIGECHF